MLLLAERAQETATESLQSVLRPIATERTPKPGECTIQFD